MNRAYEVAEPDTLAFAGSYHRRKARKAAITRKHWIDSGCQFVMGFTQFRQPSIRNKIRRDLGLDPVTLPGEKLQRA